jgi:hypothetical protein
MMATIAVSSYKQHIAVVGAILWLAFVVGCASTPRSAKGESCALRSRDSSYAAAGPVYRDCAVDRQAKQTNNDVHPDWRPSSQAPRNGCYFAELEFVVDAAGKPERGTASVVRTNDQTFADAWLTTVPSWRFEPAVRGGVPVRQIVDSRKTAMTSVVLVPAGGPLPTRPSPNVHQPTC